MTIERKSLAAAIESVDDDTAYGPHGGFVAVASTGTKDRDGENVLRKEWLPLPDHITIDSDHGMSVATTVGSAVPYWDEATGKLMIRAAFSSIARAQEVRALVKEKHIRTVSVAMMVDRSQKDGIPRRELLNVGIVAIPANKDAVILDAKSLETEGDSIDDAAVKFLTAVKAAAGSGDGAMIQAIHDAAGHLGAKCVAPEVPVDGTGDETGADDGANDSGPNGTSGKSVDTVTVTVGEKSADVPANATPEQFQAALKELLAETPSIDAGEPQGDSPADPPVEAAADAATDQVPADAPADTAGEAAEPEPVSVEKRAAYMAMALFASEHLSDD